MPADGGTLADFEAESIDGDQVSLDCYEGDVVLVVNVASKCGMTPQYDGLEKLYRAYRDRGFVVLGFPCNQFGGQEPGTADDIKQFCSTTYDVDFPMFAKVDVNGDDAHPLFAWLRSEQRGLFGGAIRWNFTKFLLDREGRPVHRYAPTTAPDKLASDIEKLLAA